MSVLVRMEMPENCKKCKNPICLWVDDKRDGLDVIAAVQDFRKKNDGGFPDFCPVICSIPEEHGDLVDWNDVEKELEGTFAGYVDDVPYFDNGQPVLLRRKVYPDALMIRPIKVKIIIPKEGGKENK